VRSSWMIWGLALLGAGCPAIDPMSSTPTCDQVCKQVTTVCAPSGAGCQTHCPALPADVRACLAHVGSCSEANACVGAPTESSADSSMTADLDVPPAAVDMRSGGLDMSIAPDRCPNGYLLGDSICTDSDMQTVLGCQLSMGVLLDVRIRCPTGLGYVCLQKGNAEGQEKAACCPVNGTGIDDPKCHFFN
jgi:hypothetical protein